MQNAFAIANAVANANALAVIAKMPDQREERRDCMERRRSERPQNTGTTQYIGGYEYKEHENCE